MSEYFRGSHLETRRTDPTTLFDSRNRYSVSTGEFEPTSEASSSSHSSENSHHHSINHRRTTSWQPPARPESSSNQPSPSLLPYSCPSSPSPSSVSRASSIHSSSTSSRRPLPHPPTDVPRFVPFRPPPSPPPSLSTHSSAYDEKRDLTRLRGLDDLLEREGESEGESSSSSPTFSDLPAYEGSLSRETASAAKRMLLEETDGGEEEKQSVELDEVRRRANEESLRIIEEDSRNGKQRLLEQREQEQAERRRIEEVRREVEMGKRVEAERERMESPPPPLSPTSRDMLPLEDSKDNDFPTNPFITAQSVPPARKSTFRQTTFPSPSPITTYSTPIPSSSSPSSHSSSSLLSTPRNDPHSSRTQVNRPGVCFYGSNHSGTPINGTLRPPRLEHNASPGVSTPKERQGSIGPASSFYSSAVGLTIEQLRLDDRQRQNRELSESTSSSSLSSRPLPVDSHPSNRDNRHHLDSFDTPVITPQNHPSQSSLLPTRPQIASSAHYTVEPTPTHQSTISPLHYQPQYAAQSLPSPFPSPLPSNFRGSEPAFYHSIGGQLLPFYPTSTSNSEGPQTFISPAAARTPVSYLPPPPPTPVSQFSHYSMSPVSSQPTPFSTMYSTTQSSVPFEQIRQTSPAPSNEPSKTRANRMSSIKNLFGRKGGRERSQSQMGHEWNVQEE
ncbi:hypothetical protein JCM3765_007917 [Sporobolomyces pararoseus]